MKNKKLWGLIILVVIVAAVLSIYIGGQGEASRQAYRFAEVSEGTIQAIVSSTGTIRAVNTVKVGSQVSGTIKKIYVDFNDRVSKGQVVALIDPAVYSAQVQQAEAGILIAKAQYQEKLKDILAAEAGVMSSRASLESSEATLKQAKLIFDRQTALEKQKIVSRSELDNAVVRRDNAIGGLKVAKAKLQSSLANLERVKAQREGAIARLAEKEATLNLAKIRLAYCTIRSPIDGVIIYRAVDMGQTVAASLQSPVLFHIAENLRKMQIEVDVSESDVGQIKPDQKVNFTVDAYPDEKFKAQVYQVRYFSQEIQSVVTYKVIADVQNRNLLLKPGMTANVTVIVAKEENVLKVPNAALRFKPLGQIKKADKKAAGSDRQAKYHKELVDKIGLNRQQSKKLKTVLKNAGAKLGAAMQVPEEERDMKTAFRSFVMQVWGSIDKMITKEQRKPWAKYKQEAMKKFQTAKKQKSKPSQVYILDKDGKPKEIKIAIGISNETETKIVRGEIKKGDKVIIGLDAFAAEESGKKNPFSKLARAFGRK